MIQLRTEPPSFSELLRGAPRSLFARSPRSSCCAPLCRGALRLNGSTCPDEKLKEQRHRGTPNMERDT